MFKLGRNRALASAFAAPKVCLPSAQFSARSPGIILPETNAAKHHHSSRPLSDCPASRNNDEL